MQRVPTALLILVAALTFIAPSASAEDTPQLPIEIATGEPWKRHAIDATSIGADGVKLGDINGDGLPDIVTAWEEGGEVRLYLHPGYAKSREPWPPRGGLNRARRS